MTMSSAEVRGATVAIPASEQEAATNAPSERRLTGGTLFLLAGLAALGALATNIILPAFPRMALAAAVDRA